jgi:hypothetical protein
VSEGRHLLPIKKIELSGLLRATPTVEIWLLSVGTWGHVNSSCVVCAPTGRPIRELSFRVHGGFLGEVSWSAGPTLAIENCAPLAVCPFPPGSPMGLSCANPRSIWGDTEWTSWEMSHKAGKPILIRSHFPLERSCRPRSLFGEGDTGKETVPVLFTECAHPFGGFPPLALEPLRFWTPTKYILSMSPC